MQLLPIRRDGTIADHTLPLPPEAREVLSTFAGSYAKAFLPPWIGYIAVENAQAVGTCAFKSPPTGGRVEIAYFTFPAHEGRGVATRMARELISLARTTDPSVQVIAQTMPSGNASTRVLRKLGFVHACDAQDHEIGLCWEWHLPRDSGA
jgi:[ribosomal protein S5]-alanine N-acetyltransferase